MWLEVGNLHTTVIRRTADEREWLADYLSFTDRKAHFSRGEDQVSLFNMISETFPSGLVPIVQKGAQEEKLEVQIKDVRSPGVSRETSADLAWLRDYQNEALDRIVSRERGIVWCPTGSGKTEIMVAATLALPCPWLMIVHRGGLVDQAAERFKLRTGATAGTISEGRWQVRDDSWFVCATFQSIANALKNKHTRERAMAFLNTRVGVMIDECHTLPAGSFWSVCMSIQNARYRIGFSGTPLARGDYRSVLAVAALGDIIYRIKTEDLIERGVLAKPHVRMLEVKQLPTAVTWPGVYGEAIVRSAARTRAVLEAAERCRKPAFLFVKEIQHGRLLTDALMRKGINAQFIWGKHSLSWRKRAVRDLVAGRCDVLVCSVVFQEGIDVPELRGVVVASGGRSVIATLQRLGRGMRPEHDAIGNIVPGSEDFDVWDIADHGCGCNRMNKTGAAWHKGCEWLDRHTRERTTAYVSEGFETIIEQSSGEELSKTHTTK